MTSPETNHNEDALKALIAKGVRMPGPGAVFVGGDVEPRRISADVTIHPGCRLSGEELSIGPGSELGRESPAIVINCQLGANVSLAGGYFEGSVFLDGVTLGSAAHVRPGCLLEEQSSCGHAVGLKQTLLMPFVTTGSLINLCDCTLAGGTSRQDHTEVGSSYVHFNFSPHKDKATASLIGDVPHGVMLDQPPIFLGGQGGLVGPARVAFGTVLAAGSILRKDVLKPGQLLSIAPPLTDRPFDATVFPKLERKSLNNRLYLGNLYAMIAWYRHVREHFWVRTAHGRACGLGAEKVLHSMLQERLKRVDHWLSLVSAAESPAISEGEKSQLASVWKNVRQALGADAIPESANAQRDAFLALAGDPKSDRTYLDFIHRLSPEARQLGTAWLQTLVNAVAKL